jgi:hypothetical protein
MVQKIILFTYSTVIFLCSLSSEVKSEEEKCSIDPDNPPVYVAAFEGTCKSLTIKGLPTELECAPILMMSKFKSGGAVFILQQMKGNVIAFHVSKPDSSDELWKVYSVSILSENGDDERKGSGQCDFILDSQGLGSLKCKAIIGSEVFSTDFDIKKTKNVVEQN